MSEQPPDETPDETPHVEVQAGLASASGTAPDLGPADDAEDGG